MTEGLIEAGSDQHHLELRVLKDFGRVVGCLNAMLKLRRTKSQDRVLGQILKDCFSGLKFAVPGPGGKGVAVYMNPTLCQKMKSHC
mgnify:CR=1 FL=1